MLRLGAVRVTFAAIVLCGVAASSGSAGARPPTPGGPTGLTGRASRVTRTMGKDPGVQVPVPDGFDAEGKRTGPRAETLALTDGGDVLVVTVYRATANDRAPSANAALRAHAEELAKAVGADERLGSARIAGREVPSREFEYKKSGVAWHAVVVALDAGDTIGTLTIVAVWVAVAGGPGERELGDATAEIETK